MAQIIVITLVSDVEILEVMRSNFYTASSKIHFSILLFRILIEFYAFSLCTFLRCPRLWLSKFLLPCFMRIFSSISDRIQDCGKNLRKRSYESQLSQSVTLLKGVGLFFYLSCYVVWNLIDHSIFFLNHHTCIIIQMSIWYRPSNMLRVM